MLPKFTLQPKASKTTLKSPNHLQPNHPNMSSDTKEFIWRHFSNLQEEDIEFTSGQSKTHFHLLEQSTDEEERDKKKWTTAQKAPQKIGEPSTANIIFLKKDLNACLTTNILKPKQL